MATSRPALTALTALAPVSWGTTYAVTTEFLPADRPLFTGLMRALPAGLLLLCLARVLPRGAWWWKAAVLGALNIGAFFPLLFLSAYRLPGGMAAVVGSVGPLFVVGLSALLLGRRPTARTLLTGVAAALGETAWSYSRRPARSTPWACWPPSPPAPPCPPGPS